VNVGGLVLRRIIDLPPVIVWDALVDPDLLAGWLGEVRMLPSDHSAGNSGSTARPLSAFEFRWPGSSPARVITGTVSALQAPRLLRVETDNRGRIEFTLVSIVGGSRGLSTELELRVDSSIQLSSATTVRDEWQTSLDRLEQLLHGHPVDWVNLDTRSDGSAGVGGASGHSVNSSG
jgi:uncharacterized protein YndB with AHSA1/START domain